jgi:lysophospholipase L1-like esterase
MSTRRWSLVVTLGLIGAAIVLWCHEWPGSGRHKDDGYQTGGPAEMPGNLEEYLKVNEGPIDILLLGDSITQQWGSPLDTRRLNTAWKKKFGVYKTVNLGVAGYKTEDVLGRLDQGAVMRLRPRLVVLAIGVNDLLYMKPEATAESVARDIEACLTKIQHGFPSADIVVTKILPAHGLDTNLERNIRDTNHVLDRLRLDSAPRVHVLDLTRDFAEADGTLKKHLFFVDTVHISLEGYGVYAERLQPFIDRLLGGKGIGGDRQTERNEGMSAPR